MAPMQTSLFAECTYPPIFLATSAIECNEYCFINAAKDLIKLLRGVN